MKMNNLTNKNIYFETLDELPIQKILDTHNEAFSDYEVSILLNLELFEYLNLRRGVRYDLSIGAFERDVLIGFILNAIGEWDGIATAYDCGTGVIPNFRKKGVGDRIFKECSSLLKAEGINQYLLEVIQTNSAAINLYRKRDFKVSREFDCLTAERKKVETNLKNKESKYIIKEINMVDKNLIETFSDYIASWQNSYESIERVKKSFQYYGAFLNEKIVGFIVFQSNGSITQIAVDKNYRNQGIASGLLRQMCNKTTQSAISLRIINVDTRDNVLLSFLQHIGFKSFTKQYEMLLKWSI